MLKSQDIGYEPGLKGKRFSLLIILMYDFIKESIGIFMPLLCLCIVFFWLRWRRSYEFYYHRRSMAINQ